MSTLKPDIVIIDKKTMSVNIFELTVPGELRLDIANSIKMEKYQHFTSDIKQFTASVIPFEVGAHTGHISTRNKENINKLHKEYQIKFV